LGFGETHFLKVLVFCFLCQIGIIEPLHAQGDTLRGPPIKSIRKNTFFPEILGNGAVYSFNYDRIIPFKDKLGLTFLRIFSPSITSINYGAL
jgi:hypothetical protein